MKSGSIVPLVSFVLVVVAVASRAEDSNAFDAPYSGIVGESVRFDVPVGTRAADVIMLRNLRPVDQTAFAIDDTTLTLVPPSPGEYLILIRQAEDVQDHRLRINAKPEPSPQLVSELERIESRISLLEKELKKLRELEQQLRRVVSPQND